MMVLEWILLFAAVFVVLNFNRASFIVTSIAFAFLLLLVSFFSRLSPTTLTIFWICFAVVFSVLSIKPLRRRLITRHILNLYRRVMPSISATEREALTAGGVGWEGELFTGIPDWEQLHKMPQGSLSVEEQNFLDGPVETLCSMISDWEINQRSFNIPETIWQFLKIHGFFGMIISKEYGGKAFSALAHSQVLTKVSSVSVAVATVISVPNSLGPAELLQHYGTTSQKNYYLPRLASGEEIPCFALTSPVAGSDASAIVDEGIICKTVINDQEVLAIRLNWNKRYITLSPIATLIGLAVKLYDPEHLLGPKEDVGITCVLIPVDTPGVKTGRRHFPLCSAFPNGPTQGQDVHIPLDAIIGGPTMAGHGWGMLMECLAAGRSISLPGMVVGGAKRVLYASGAYARIRQQFNTYIGNFGGVQEALTKIGGYTYLVEALRLFTVTAVDRGLKPAVASAISKYHTTELSRVVMNLAMDIHGGKGICMGPSNYLAQNYIESPISITVEGANILTRSMIIFGQGAIRCHPYVLSEMNATEEADYKKGLRDFDRAIFFHIRYFFSNVCRSWVLGITAGYFAKAPTSDLKRYYQRFSRYAAAFCMTVDVMMLTLGSSLKRKEKISGRLGDILSNLYMASAAMKYYELQNEPELLPFVTWACDELLHRTQFAFDQVLRNLSKHRYMFLLRYFIFPVGRRSNPPSDRLGVDVAELLLSPSSARARLSQHVYTRDTAHNPIGKIERAFELAIAVEPLEKRLHQAIKAKIAHGKNFYERVQSAKDASLFTTDEVNALLAAFAARMEVINVDDFSEAELISRFSQSGDH